MSRHRDWDVSCKVYIGNLGNNASKYELEDAFSKYGPLRNVWVARNPPGFAFVEFEDARDAEDAVKAVDGTRICGVKIEWLYFHNSLLILFWLLLKKCCYPSPFTIWRLDSNFQNRVRVEMSSGQSRAGGRGGSRDGRRDSDRRDDRRSGRSSGGRRDR